MNTVLFDTNVVLDVLLDRRPYIHDIHASAAARLAGCDFIVTRDPKGFRGLAQGGSPVRPLTPEAVLPLLAE